MTITRTSSLPCPARALHLLALASLAALPAASAVAQDNTYFYGGVGVGQSRSHLDDQRVVDRALGGGSGILVDRDRSHTGYRVFGGRQMNRYLALELGYFDLGNFGFAAATRGVPAGTLSSTLKVQGASLDLVATLPVTENLAMLARAGATYAKSRRSYQGSAAPADRSPSHREGNPKIGVGLQYALGPSMLLRGEIERYRVGDAAGHRGNVDMVSVGLVFPFGRSPAPARPMAMSGPPRMSAEPRPMAMPMPMAAPEPAPPPIVAAAPPPPLVSPPVPERRRVSYVAESLFDFDSSSIKPEGQRQLDGFVRELEGSNFDRIEVEGHTDRLGSTDYNQALSLRRAEAVKSYLVTAGRLDADRIATAGRGESAPVTHAGDCAGTAQTARLKACLQPDRRVEIEVTATR